MLTLPSLMCFGCAMNFKVEIQNFGLLYAIATTGLSWNAAKLSKKDMKNKERG